MGAPYGNKNAAGKRGGRGKGPALKFVKAYKAGRIKRASSPRLSTKDRHTLGKLSNLMKNANRM